jgi:hypothetical protein
LTTNAEHGAITPQNNRQIGGFLEILELDDLQIGLRQMGGCRRFNAELAAMIGEDLG